MTSLVLADLLSFQLEELAESRVIWHSYNIDTVEILIELSRILHGLQITPFERYKTLISFKNKEVLQQ